MIVFYEPQLVTQQFFRGGYLSLNGTTVCLEEVECLCERFSLGGGFHCLYNFHIPIQ